VLVGEDFGPVEDGATRKAAPGVFVTLKKVRRC